MPNLIRNALAILAGVHARGGSGRSCGSPQADTEREHRSQIACTSLS